MTHIERIEYVRCMLEQPDDIGDIAVPARSWTADTIPADALAAIEEERILELPGRLGERELGVFDQA